MALFLICVASAAIAVLLVSVFVEWKVSQDFGETEVPARPIITPRLTSPPPPPARTLQTVNNSPVYSVSAPSPTPDRQQESGSDGFVTSAVIGAVTNNGLLGGFIGGNFAGGMIGDAIVDGSLDLGCSHSNDSTPSYESPATYDSPSVDYSSSSDSFSGGTDFGGGDF